MAELITELVFWAIVVGAVLFIPGLFALMVAYAIWEHRNPSREFIAPTYYVVKDLDEAERLRVAAVKAETMSADAQLDSWRL